MRLAVFFYDTTTSKSRKAEYFVEKLNAVKNSITTHTFMLLLGDTWTLWVLMWSTLRFLVLLLCYICLCLGCRILRWKNCHYPLKPLGMLGVSLRISLKHLFVGWGSQIRNVILMGKFFFKFQVNGLKVDFYSSKLLRTSMIVVHHTNFQMVKFLIVTIEHLILMCSL